MFDSMPIEEVENGLCPRDTLFAMSSVSHEIRFTPHVLRSYYRRYPMNTVARER